MRPPSTVGPSGEKNFGVEIPSQLRHTAQTQLH